MFTDPQQLKNFTISGLEELAAEIRRIISSSVPITGGHIGPSLGCVEIIIACHTVFTLHRDRLIFDVGHQAYPHKIITGRLARFNTLRQKNGLSGYPHFVESEYDVFRSGHASTAISTGLGLLEGFQKNKQTSDIKVIALVGDGSLTGGMAFEGLNNCGHLKKNLIVLFNDNTMSISPTIGALAAQFNKLRHQKIVGNIIDDVKGLVKKIPKFGRSLEDLIRLVLVEARHMFTPGLLFSDLGFDYIGPIDGHDLKKVISALTLAKNETKPVVVHFLTQKGRGFIAGDKDGKNVKYSVCPHAVGPLSSRIASVTVSGQKTPETVSYSMVFADQLITMAGRDNRIAGITAAMAEGTGLEKFSEQFPSRCYDVGICEQHAVGFAAGLAAAGLRPFFAVYSTFLQRAFDQVFHELILQGSLPVVLAVDRAGLVGEDGPSHQGIYDIAYLRVFPDIILMAPKDGYELRLMMNFAVETNKTTAIRYPRDVFPSEKQFSVYTEVTAGSYEILSEGRDVLILALGSMVKTALNAAEKLKTEGTETTVVNARFVKPINEEKLSALIKKYKYVFTIEEGAVQGGFGSMVGEIMHRNRITHIPLTMFGIPDLLIEHASREEQLVQCGLDCSTLCRRIRDEIKKK